MIRVFLLILLPIMIPTLAYMGWVFMQRRKAKAAGVPEDAPTIQEAPWGLLITLSAAMLIVGIVIFLFIDNRSDLGSVYIPPKIEDGRIVPGQYVPAGEAEPDKVFD